MYKYIYIHIHVKMVHVYIHIHVKMVHVHVHMYYHIAGIFRSGKFSHVTVNKCITELIHGFIIRATQVHTCTVHAHTHMQQIFVHAIFADSFYHEKCEN